VHRFVGEINLTSTGMMVLRELTPLFMVLALLVLVYLWTGFKWFARSVLLFVFLLSIPAVFDNNTWWHPDSMAILFAVLTMFALVKDAFRFGKWFYAAAFFCGLAAGTKVIGLFFVFTLAVYLLWPLLARRYGFQFLFKQGVAFLLLMALGIVLANPL